MTLREHLEAILLVPRPGAGRVPEWNEAANAVSKHVLSALAMLDDAHRCRVYMGEPVWVRVVPDPDRGVS